MELDLTSKVKLSDVCNIRYGKDHKKLNGGSIPLYGSGGIMRYVDSALYDKESVLIPRKGTLGNLFFTKEPFWTIDTLFYTEIDNSKIVPKYLYYKLKNLDLANMNVGTAVPSLTTALLNEIELYLPSLNYQKKVVDILSSFDKKIENNKAVIKNLEEQTHAIFKAWFMDFEPFQYQEFMNTDLGKIPKDWKVVTLDEITKLSTESFKPRNSIVKKVYHFSIPAYDDNEYPVYDEVETIKSNKYLINSNSILVSKLNPATQRVWFPNIKDDELNVSSTEFLVLNSKDSETKSFIYEVVRSTDFYNYLTSNVTGTTNSRQRVKPKVAMDFKIAIHKEVIRNFGKIINPFHLKILNLRAENIRLSEIRDILLPQLISGEIRVEEGVETN